jgi:DNA polymerase (family 10)
MIAADNPFMSFPLAKLRDYADRIVSELAPHCERIEIAGSIRRGLPDVNDIDLVILPKSPAAQAAIIARCKERGALVTGGTQNSIFRFGHGPAQFQLDLYFAEHASRDLFGKAPGNWGSLLLCRTGSKEHNIKLVQRAKRLGKSWNPYYGVYQHNKLVASETEESIFAALEMDFVSPEGRG